MKYFLIEEEILGYFYILFWHQVAVEKAVILIHQAVLNNVASR